MSLAAPCPGHWNYEDHPRRTQLLPPRIVALLKELRAGAFPAPDAAADTRPVHKRLFIGLTPLHFPYYAGNYRGAVGLRCLDVHEVEIVGDPEVGSLAENVEKEMMALAEEIRSGVAKADAVHADASRPEDERVLEVVTLACDAFVRFLTIHPYANGNGHSARFLLWSFLGRYGLWPDAWTIEPRPAHRHYNNGIHLYRRGSKERLVAAVLESLAPPSTATATAPTT